MRIRKTVKRFFCVAVALGLAILGSSSVRAAELPVTISVDDLQNISQYDTNGDGLVYAVIEVSSVSVQATSATSQNGEVVGTGVRLRNAPSSSASVLELMYNGEAVCISYSVSATASGWYYLERLKTGTWGWASSAYISSWDL